ncbi:MAG: class I SAM-dependent methyltransferase [Anaerolineae bacterium]|nr:class I SAM-dependent methyltransferase [Anaerolineae bacterium]
MRESVVPARGVTAFPPAIDLATLELVNQAPAWLSPAERLLLYTLIYSLRPARYLEIGTFKGGSALIAIAAMEASANDGKIVCVEPHPQLPEEHQARILTRATLIEGFSPDVLPRAYEVAGGPFDFVFIDGDHTSRGVRRDAEGVLPFVAEGAYLLFHDGFFPDVADGIRSFLTRHSSQVVDCGILTREISPEITSSPSLFWGGMWLVQVRGAQR